MSESAIQAQEDARCAALLAADHDRLAEVLASDLSYVHSDGRIHDRAELLAFLQRHVRFSAIAHRRWSINVQRDLAWATGLLCMSGSLLPSGESVRLASHACQVWRRRPIGGWVLVHMQSTRIPEQMWDASVVA